MIDPKNLEALTDPEVTIGQTDFDFEKMPAMKGFDTLMEIREEVGKQMRPEEINPDIIRIVLSLPVSYILKLRSVMFAYVYFRSASTDRQQVKGAEDMAFDGLEPGAVTEVLLRSLCVNFYPSFRGIIEQISRVFFQKAPTRRKKQGG